MIRIILVASTALGCSAVFADEYMIIHARNQKHDSEVAAYWRSFSKMDQPRDFASVHDDNQKIGSEVAAYWQSLTVLSEANCE